MLNHLSNNLCLSFATCDMERSLFPPGRDLQACPILEELRNASVATVASTVVYGRPSVNVLDVDVGTGLESTKTRTE